MGHRRKAREFAMQALYMYETVGAPVDELTRLDWVDKEIPEDIMDFAINLITGTIANIDCIDNLTAKTFLLNECRTQNLKVITSGGASAKMDPTRIRITDLAKTVIDPMSHTVRKILRQEYNFPKDYIQYLESIETQ